MSQRTSYKLICTAVVATVGIGVAAFAAYQYFKKRRSLVQAVPSSDLSNGSPSSQMKVKLKSLLKSDNVHCGDEDHVEEVIDRLIQAGAPSLQVIADFDRTMTPMSHNRKPVPSTHGVIESCPHLPDWYKEETDKTRIYYQSIEFNPSMSKEEKIPFMEEWWHKAQERLTRCAISRADLEQGVKQSNLYLRRKTEDILDLLYIHDVPLLVFSAGVGDVIEQMFLQRYNLYDNIHIIANWMDFNHQGVLVGFKGETIHTFNKDSHAVQHAPYFDNLSRRHNVILLGDSLGDLDIKSGLNNHENVLTIGYLNEQVEASLAEYVGRFDIVLKNAESAELLLLLLQNIISSGDS